MAEKKENIITHSMHSGLILGGLLVVCDFLSMNVFNNNVLAILLLAITGFIISIYCIFFFTKNFDKEVLKGKISYTNALSYGFYIFFFAAMIVALFSFIYFQYINPDYLAQRGEMLTNLFKQLNNFFQLNPQETAMIKTYENRFINMEVPSNANAAFEILWSVAINGFIICLFTSLFFRKRKNNTE